MMLAETYSNLRKRLQADGAFRVRDLYGSATVTAECCVLVGGVAAIAYVTPFSLLYWVLQVVLAFSMFRMFVIVHECGHNTLFRKRGVNTFIGSLVSPACLLPYIPWRNIHVQHHKWVGVVDKDPTQAHLLNLRDMSHTESALFRLVWKLWIPVPFMLFVVRVFWLYPVRELMAGRRLHARQGALSVLMCITPHCALLAFVGVTRYLVLFGPAILLFYVIYEIINLPQHSGLFPYTSDTHPEPIPLREQDEITRTTYLPRWLAILLNYNFNFHIEHHLFPSIPWYALPEVTRRLEGLSGFQYQRVAFLKFMVHLRQEDPIDVYVRSLPPMEVENA